MGEFRFQVPADWKLDPYHANSIHLVGLEGIPKPCRISTTTPPEHPDQTVLSVSSNHDGSGRVFVIYPLADRGEMMLSTGTLPLRAKPFRLLTELARGTLNRIRNQLSIWEEGGLKVSDTIRDQIATATRSLGASILNSNFEQSQQSAAEAIETTIDAIFQLAQTFGDQVCEFRRQQEQLSTFWVGASVTDFEQLAAAKDESLFDRLQISTNLIGQSGDRERLSDKQTIAGPWLDASVDGMKPDLIHAPDFKTRQSMLESQCRRELHQLPMETSLLHLISGLNGMGNRHLSYPQQLQITIALLRLAEEERGDLPTLISFDFPWAERLAGAVGGSHPLQIADSLLRQGVRISYLGLEINLDYWPNGSIVRDPLQWVDLIDIWAQFGIPLIVYLRVPMLGEEGQYEATIDQDINRPRSNLTEQNRIDFLDTVLPVLVARPSVQGLIWRQWNDNDDRRFANGGIVNQDESQRPIWESIKKMRSAITGQ